MAVQQVNLKWKCTKTSTSDPFPSQLTYDLHSSDRVRALSIRLNSDHSAVCDMCAQCEIKYWSSCPQCTWIFCWRTETLLNFTIKKKQPIWTTNRKRNDFTQRHHGEPQCDLSSRSKSLDNIAQIYSVFKRFSLCPTSPLPAQLKHPQNYGSSKPFTAETKLH